MKNNSGRLLVNIGPLERRKYGVRIEGIIDPKDDESNFDFDVSGVSTCLIETRTKYKGKIEPHAIALDLEIELRENARNLNIALNITHVPNKEIALFIFGRRSEGHVDPQIVENIDYRRVKDPGTHGPNNGFKYQNIPISYDGKKVRVRLSGRFQIKQYNDDFNLSVTVDSGNRKLFEEFEKQLRTPVQASLRTLSKGVDASLTMIN